MVRASFLRCISVPDGFARVSVGFVHVKPMVAFGEMLVSEEMTVHQSTSDDVAIVVLNLVEFLAYFTLVVVLGFDQRLSVETRKAVDARDFALLSKRQEGWVGGCFRSVRRLTYSSSLSNVIDSFVARSQMRRRNTRVSR